MKLFEKLPGFLNENFCILEPDSPYTNKLAVEVDSGSADTSVFSLSELLSSEVLSALIYRWRNNESVEKPSNSNDTSDTKVMPNQIEQRCKFAELYLEALETAPYDFFEKPAAFSMKIADILQEKNADLLAEIDDDNIPVLKILEKYDIELIKLICQMRYHLFIKTSIKLCPDTLFNLLNYYELLLFNPDSTCDIFLKYEPEKYAHLKIKCDIMFALNLYFLLQMNSEVSSNKTDTPDTPNILDPESAALYSLFSRIKFIKPLFRIVEIISHENEYSIKLNDAFSDLRYRRTEGDKICLFTPTRESTHDHVTFLNLFNEGNGVFKKVISYEALATEEITEDLDGMISAVLQLFPDIKTLNISNKPKSKYNNPKQDKYSYYDMFLESLVSNNEESLKALTGFKVYGFNRLTLRTVVLLKQHRFEHFGMRGINSCVDPLYLFLLFRTETIETLIDLHKIYGIEYTLDDVEKYNSLRNSVTHLTGTEEIVRDAVKYCLVENIRGASAFLHGYNNNCELFHEESLILAQFTQFKDSCKNVKQTPLALKTLEIYPERDYMKEFTNMLRETNKRIATKNFFSQPMQCKTCIYEVSALVVTSTLIYERSLNNTQDLFAVVNFSDNLVVSFTLGERIDQSGILKCLANLELDDKAMTICYPLEDFFSETEEPNNNPVTQFAKSTIEYIYHRYIYKSEQAKLTIMFHSQKYQIINTDVWKDEVLDFILERSSSGNKPCDSKSVLREKIRFEMEG
ncbi:hypothetical protein ENBRE01_1561 [Enteropsectra breve]|nr:hypothetical protein ENBRE01_1561 [Enteropsectra breve]